jgi:hypothetical protein
MDLTGKQKHWLNGTDRRIEAWSVGGMLLTGEQKCAALVEWY